MAGRALAAPVAVAVWASLLVAVAPPARAGCPGVEALSDGEKARSLVVVVADTVRRDRPGAYGGSARTPAFDAFASAHWLFTNASSQAPWTKPSVATLFTSLYPSQHLVSSDPQLQGAFGVTRSTEVTRADRLPASLTTLAEWLRAAGARTGAVVANPWMDRRYGFAQGFDVYEDALADWDAPGEAVSGAALAWLDTVPEGEAYFLYVHYLDPHRPYGRLTPEEARAVAPDARPLDAKGERFARGQLRLADGLSLEDAGVAPSAALLERAYDRGVERFDAALGVLLDGLRARGDWDRTAVVVTSDHGEGLYERGYGNHGGGLFEAEVAVPLVIRAPGFAPRTARLDCLVGLVDLMPTACDLLGVARPEGLAGRSLLDGRPAPAVLVSEGVMTRPGNRAVRDESHKLLHEPEGRRDGLDAQGPTSLYRLGNAGETGPDRVAREDEAATRERLERALAEAVPPWVPAPPESAPVDRAMQERLQELGYVDGPGPLDGLDGAGEGASAAPAPEGTAAPLR